MSHTRMVLPAGAPKRRDCDIVLSACRLLSLCLGSVLMRGKKTDTILPVRTCENKIRPDAAKPGKSHYTLPPKKTLERLATRDKMLGSRQNVDARVRPAFLRQTLWWLV